jgi:hypothetical protein
MEAKKQPDPIHDELSDEVKADLARQFAALRYLYSSDYHTQWRTYQRIHNAGMIALSWEERYGRQRPRWSED